MFIRDVIFAHVKLAILETDAFVMVSSIATIIISEVKGHVQWGHCTGDGFIFLRPLSLVEGDSRPGGFEKCKFFHLG